MIFGAGIYGAEVFGGLLIPLSEEVFVNWDGNMNLPQMTGGFNG